jgi:hypothetical protein
VIPLFLMPADIDVPDSTDFPEEAQAREVTATVRGLSAARDESQAPLSAGEDGACGCQDRPPNVSRPHRPATSPRP